MGFLRPLRFTFTLLAFTALFTIIGAQDAPALNPLKDTISDGQPLRDNVLLYPLYGQLAKNQIDGLLVSLKLWRRQQEVACATNYTECQGTQFCCPNGSACCSSGTCCGAGTYCTTVGGVQGCCALGHVCTQITDQCTVAGQQRCPNENFCCPAGNTCYRDGSNNPRCSSSNSTTPSSTSNPTNSISFVPAHPSNTGTPASTNTPLETICQLQLFKAQGLFRRRKRAPVHPGPKRWGWF